MPAPRWPASSAATRRRAEVWIVDPDRGNRPAFNRRMAALGYALEDCRIDTLASLGALAYRGRLLVYRRGG
jgi:hypothetical protein